MKYRKKPVVVEAVQLTWGTWNAVCDFLAAHGAPPADAMTRGVYLDHHGDPLPEGSHSEHLGLIVTTVHGEQAIVREGDWVIPDGKPGTFYPCKPDIFAATYEPVPEKHNPDAYLVTPKEPA